VLSAKAHPASYDFVAALGETYHNAWKQCVKKTTTWLDEDLEVNKEDPAFDNGYYVEYNIKKKVPRVYEIFRELLGEDNYWPSPKFTTANDKFHVIFDNTGDWEPSSHAQIMEELPDPYTGNEDLSWIREHNHPNPASKKIPIYADVPAAELSTWSDGGRLLKELFYNIQQTSYYCDFTLESAMFSLEKVGAYAKEEQVEVAREETAEMWAYILKKQVAPLRWGLKIWTRYNIAEPAVHQMVDHFRNDWELSMNALSTLPVDAIVESLGWDNYAERLQHESDIVDQWVVTFNEWTGSCYPAPSDRTINTSDKICQHGITSDAIRNGEKDAASMWFDFFLPILQEYENQPHFNQDIYDRAYKNLIESVYELGAPHSFRCEFIWIRTRVRYFEIIPTWEIERVRDDTIREFNKIVEFRNAIVAEPYNIPAEGIYSEEHMN
jgi:hypothetical protein